MSDKEYQTATDSDLCAYMTLLGLEVLTPENLTLSYRSLMRTQHVDKGGDLQTTQTITQAYRILKLCLENNRYVPSSSSSSARNSRPGPSTSNSSNYDQHHAYANTDDSWAQYSKCFKPKTRNPKYFFKPTKFDKAFQNGWQRHEDADDPVNSDLGKARSKPKKYNNGYMYDEDDEYIPNDRQNYS
uniref:J domain-containing protein n=1 Tax=Panagrolaimus sp. ES5 TaxID=591445 RepID=A0AC34GGD6_9BILA